MIEFRADCGHAVRAKDSDVGGTIKCKYCGRDVLVPAPDGGASDDFFSQPPTPHPVTSSRVTKPPPRRGGKPPIGLIKILTGLGYVIVAVVLVVLGFEMIVNNHRDDVVPAAPSPQASPTETPARPSRATGMNPFAQCGSLDKSEGGLVVLSIPSGAKVYVSGGPDAVSEVYPHRDSNLLEGDTSRSLVLNRPIGAYRIGLTMPINAPEFRQYGENFRAYRREVEEGTRADVDYFLGDGADECGIDASYRPIRLYRTYPVELRSQEWSVVVALFVPDVPVDELLGKLPSDYAFGFDEEDVAAELEFYGVGALDRVSVMKALRKIGKITWPGDDTYGPMVFQIRPNGQVVRIDW